MTTSPEPNFYRILNVHHQADPEIIQEAYQRLREKYEGASAAERELDEAYRVLSDPEKRAAYDARRRAALMAGGGQNLASTSAKPVSKPAQSVAPAPKKTIAPKPAPFPADAESERHTVPARCSLYGDGYDIVLMRAKGPIPRFRVVAFEAWLPQQVESENAQSFLSRLFKSAGYKPKASTEPASGPADNEYLEFSKFDFGQHRCPVCEGEAPPAYGPARHWAMCGRCDHILCMGAADDDPGSLAVTCPWCTATIRFGGPTKTGGKVKASQPVQFVKRKTDKPPQLPGSKKQLPKG